MNAHIDLAKRYLQAINDADVDTIRSIYADDAVIWHSFDRREQPVAENIASLLALKKAMPDVAWQLEMLEGREQGFLLTYQLTAQLQGKAVSTRACVIGTVEAGRITRIDEWIDVQRLLGRLTPEQLKALAS